MRVLLVVLFYAIFWSPVVLSSAAEGISVKNADALTRSEGKRQAVHGRIKKIVWDDGGLRNPGRSDNYFFVFFEGSDSFAVKIYGRTYNRSKIKLDEDAQQLVGKVIRAEEIIRAKHPNQRNPLEPDMHMLVRSPDSVSFVSSRKAPTTAPTNRPKLRQADQADMEKIQEALNNTSVQAKEKLARAKEKLARSKQDLAEEEAHLAALSTKYLRLAHAKFKLRDNAFELTKVCFNRYRVFEENWLFANLVAKAKRKPFAAHVAYLLKQHGQKKEHCGIALMSQLFEVVPAVYPLWNAKTIQQKARTYTLAAFEAHHEIDPSDAHSASFLSALYRSGIGGSRDQKLADRWMKKSAQRKSALAGADRRGKNSAPRKSVLAGKVREPTVSKDGKFTVLSYGEVPKDFVPEIGPLPKNKSLKIKMDNDHPGSLRKIRIDPFGRWHLVKTRFDYMNNQAAQRVIDEDNNAVIVSEALVIECSYTSEKSGNEYFYRYWYKSRPQAADPGRLRRRLSDHPLLFIRSPLDRCPSTRYLAKQHN